MKTGVKIVAIVATVMFVLALILPYIGLFGN